MRRFILALVLVLGLVTNGYCAWDASKPTDTQKLKDTPALIRANWDAIATGTDAALQITNAKVSASAAIVDTKLAQITTASKVSGAAITLLTSVPSGAGALPIANGGSGQVTATAALNAFLPSQTGNSGKVLKTNATDASWGLVSDLSIASQAQGDLLYFNGTNWVRLAAGTSGQYLKTLGAGANPTWGTITSNIPNATAGTYIECTAASTRFRGWSTSYVKMKQFTPILRAGVYTITAELHEASGVYARVYVNDIAVGAEVLQSGGEYDTHNLGDFTLAVNDVVSVYMKCQENANIGIRNVKLACTAPIIPQEVSGY